MRRLLVLLIALVLPLKSAAAVIVPIVGKPGHAHAAPGAAAQSAHAHCIGMTDASPPPAEPLHDHGCPHLAMSMLPARLASAPVQPASAPPAPQAQPARIGVVLDVPRPPPTA